MGRISTKENKNIYQQLREGLGLSREKASELTKGLTPERIEKIENEKTLPHPDEILAGLAEGISEWVHSFFRPLMILIRSMPMIVLVILIMSVMKYRYVPVTSACMILIPVFSEAVYEGCRSLDQELIDVYRMNGGFGFRVAAQVYIPLIAGYLRQAFTNAAGMGLKVAVSAEYLVQTNNSLGKAVYSSAYFSDYAEIYAYAVIMIVLVLSITEIPLKIVRAGSRKGNA